VFLDCNTQKCDALREAVQEKDDVGVGELLGAKADPYQADEVSG
jgi:hypothetical protein